MSINLKKKTTNAFAVFYNLVGEEMIIHKIIGERGRTSIDISNMNSGVYFYSVIVNSNTIARDKLIIIK